MAILSGRSHRKRKLKADINVVPYIDVMLVLLVIFMITAPLLNLGVDVDLPNSKAKSINAKADPIVVQVYPDGSYALTLKGDRKPQAMSADMLVAKVGALHRQSPQSPVLIAGEGAAKYQYVMDAIDLLQTKAQVQKVSLLTDSKQGAAK